MVSDRTPNLRSQYSELQIKNKQCTSNEDSDQLVIYKLFWFEWYPAENLIWEVNILSCKSKINNVRTTKIQISLSFINYFGFNGIR